MVMKYEPSESCLVCRALMKKAGYRPHTDECRTRVDKILEQEDGARRKDIVSRRRHEVQAHIKELEEQ